MSSAFLTYTNHRRLLILCTFKKLFSSVPKREFALQDINISFGHQVEDDSVFPTQKVPSLVTKSDDSVTLLVGRSASGKSTLLRLLAGMELPTGGRIHINGQMLGGDAGYGVMSGMPSWVKMGLPVATENECFMPQPVILQGKPDFDNKQSVLECIVQSGFDTIDRCNKDLKNKLILEEEEDTITPLLRSLAKDFATLLTISNEQLTSSPSVLSPSGEYLFGIACGCMMSIAPSLVAMQATNSSSESCINSPILLLDELFDTEHPSTVEKCIGGILGLINAGAVVISATHRPGYFEGMSTRTVTLSGGKVLTDKRTNQ